MAQQQPTLNPLVANIGFTPFPKNRVIYATKCDFSLESQFAVVGENGGIMIYNYDRFAINSWKVAGCSDCILNIQRAVRQLGFTNPFVGGDVPENHLPPTKPALYRLPLPPVSPFCETQVLCASEDKENQVCYYKVFRQDRYLTIFCYDSASGQWGSKMPYKVYRDMENCLRHRNISIPILPLKMVEDRFVQVTQLIPVQCQRQTCVQVTLDPAVPVPQTTQSTQLRNILTARNENARQMDLKVELKTLSARHEIRMMELCLEGLSLKDRVEKLRKEEEEHEDYFVVRGVFGYDDEDWYSDEEEDEEEEDDEEEDDEEEEKESEDGDDDQDDTEDSFELVDISDEDPAEI